MAALIVVLTGIARPSLTASQIPTPPAAAQNPSPMVEQTRAHERLTPTKLVGIMRSLMAPAGVPIELFPGTFASTTETSDWLLRATGLRRTPVLRWGPRGMQQLSEVRAGRFELLGFAGNSAPDHVDHLHAMPELLERTLKR